MKRSGPIARKSPMKRSGPISRTPKTPEAPQTGAEAPKKPIRRKASTPGKPKPRPKKALTLENDKIMSRICRRVGRCQAGEWIKYDSRGRRVACHVSINLQWCHIVTRKVLKIRWDDRNCVCMCASCHSYFGDHPHEFGDFIRCRDILKRYPSWSMAQAREFLDSTSTPELRGLPWTHEYLAIRSREPFTASQGYLEDENARLKNQAEELGVDWKSPFVAGWDE